MPRVNIYLNEATSELVAAWKDKISLSEVFARALQDEISAVEDGKNISDLTKHWRAPSKLETDLRLCFGLKHVLVAPKPFERDDIIRGALGAEAARYLDLIVSSGTDINVCGGRQSWETIRNLSPRRITATVRAYGVPLTEKGSHHLHSNTLATILALLYQPRSRAELVVGDFESELSSERPQVVLSSCSVFDPTSSFSELLGPDIVTELCDEGAVGEFAYSFWNRHGAELTNLKAPGSRRYTKSRLRSLSKNPKNDVILVSGGIAKRPAIREVLAQKMCNVLITTKPDAEWLLHGEETYG